MSLTWPTSDSLEDEWKRRGKAIEAGIRYCGFLEGSPLRGRPQNDFLSTRPRLSDVQQTPLKKKIKEQTLNWRPIMMIWKMKINCGILGR